jgi:hypothetical protein
MGLINDLCIKYGTDKSNNLHNYAEKYEKYFSAYKDKELKILEIGIFNGFSLKTWEEYFVKSKIYGIDILNCSSMDTDRIKTFVCDQTNLEELKKINDVYGPFDIIIDDGSHKSKDMKKTFDFLFPLLNNNGLYVVEDLHCCYWDNFSPNETDFMDRLKELLDIVNSNGKCGLAELKNISKDHFYQDKVLGEMTWWEMNVAFINLYKSIVFIGKN